MKNLKVRIGHNYNDFFTRLPIITIKKQYSYKNVYSIRNFTQDGL